MQDQPTLFDGSLKVCRDCGKAQPLTEFYPRRDTGGLWPYCKQCQRTRSRRYADDDRNREKTRARRRRNAATRRAKGSVERSSTEKQAAHSALHFALTSDKVVKPEACESCGCVPGRGHDGRSLLHGHHHDYAKPLDVVWLCSVCHGQAHRAY